MLIQVYAPMVNHSKIFMQMQQRQSQHFLKYFKKPVWSSSSEGASRVYKSLMKPISAKKKEPKQTEPMCFPLYLCEV